MSTITFTAFSSLVHGIGAHVNVIVDGKRVGSTYVGAKTKSYSFKANLAPTKAHDVKLVYNNDTVVNGVDRNLHLKSIKVAGHTIAATSRYEVYHAPGQGNLHSTGEMNWRGTAEFKLPKSLFSGVVKPPPKPVPHFYVSTTGSDSGNGSAAQPFKTLARALSAMEGSKIHTTVVEGGTYNLNSTLNLGAADSGMKFVSAWGEKAVLDGGGSLSTLVQLNGARGVTLRGLTFQNTSTSGDGAAVTLRGAGGNHITGNMFSHTGEGLLLTQGSNHNIVSGNELDNSATSAVEVKNQSNGNRFSSNLVNGTGAIGTQGGGFFLHGANNNTISYNVVKNTAGIGIGIENWDSNTINVGNRITHNIVRNSNTSSQSTDSGAIYELGRSQVDTKSIIGGNYISGPNQAASAGSHIVGIYLDDYTDGVKVINNIVANTVTNAVQIHGGSNVTIQNNIFDLGSSGKSAILFQSTSASSVGSPQPMTNNVVKQNIIASSSSNPTAFDNFSGGSPTISNNFYMDLINNHFQTNGLAQSNAHTGNAHFVNQANGNYALGSNSGAHAIGFVAIHQNGMGLHPTTAHWYA